MRVRGGVFEPPKVEMLKLPEPSRVLQVDDWNDSVICETLIANAMIMLKAYRPEAPFQLMVHSIGGCPSGLRFENGKFVGNGLRLIVDEKNDACDFAPLEELFNRVIQELRSGWFIASALDQERATYYPIDRRTYESKNGGYVMLVKQRDLYDEDRLIRHIASRLGDNSIICRSVWNREGKIPVSTNRLYMWVKKP